MTMQIAKLRAGVLGLCMTAVCAAPVLAQDAAAPHHRHGGPDGFMAKQLNLTPEQQEQMKAIHKESFEKMAAIHKEQTEKVRAILNDDQKAKFDEMQAKMAEHKGRHRHGQPDTPPPTDQ